ncbi:MAG: hypothetical protein Q8N88_04740 [Nanoarchaeota archaeon]|nr:hypothetical protein [Nanoarchaeota archaeon]
MNILIDLYKSLKKGENQFINTFLEIEDELVDWYTNSNLLKSDLYIRQQNQLKDIFFISSIFSDVSSVYLLNRPKSEIKILTLTEENPRFQKKVSIPSVLNLSQDTHAFWPGYLYWSDLALNRILATYGNLIKERKMIIRPSRIILAKKKELSNKSSVNTFFVNPNTASGNWVCVKDIPKNSIPFSYSDLERKAAKIFELILPYTLNVDEKSLIDLLNNQQEYVSIFRKTILDIVEKYIQSDQPTSFIIRDYIKPEIDQIEIIYIDLLKKTRIRIASNITYSLSLYFFSSSPDSETIAAIIGAGSLGYGILGATDTYLKYLEEKSELNKNPFYLFWKLDRINN